MMIKRFFLIPVVSVLLIAIPLFLITFFQYRSRAEDVKANIYIDTQKIEGAVPDRWRAIAQGGEESGTRMLANVVSPLAALYPRYIRLDHIYDYYDVLNRDENGKLSYNWLELDKTVCDIYHTGAKPFFSLGYMSPAISADGSLVSLPKSWDEWAEVVQKTIEHYSGKATRLCGQVAGQWMEDIYYEVWNEPDLETFGKWSIYGGEKDYKKLYFYSSVGASKAQDVHKFLLGGPTTTRAYKNWLTTFLDYVSANNLKLDFISWHHYSKDPEDFANDVKDINSWLTPEKYAKYRNLPKIISEWGYDSDPNPLSDTNIGAAHTIMSLRQLIEQNIALAFLFEAKDGPAPRWGILSYEGEKKPRYYALKMFNLLEGNNILVGGEGTHVRAFASASPRKITTLLVNYDIGAKNVELVPVTFTNLMTGTYELTITYLEGTEVKLDNIEVTNNIFRRDILMSPNSVIALELRKKI